MENRHANAESASTDRDVPAPRRRRFDGRHAGEEARRAGFTLDASHVPDSETCGIHRHVDAVSNGLT